MRCRYLAGGRRAAARSLAAADIERDAAMTLGAAAGGRTAAALGQTSSARTQETRGRAGREGAGRRRGEGASTPLTAPS